MATTFGNPGILRHPILRPVVLRPVVAGLVATHGSDSALRWNPELLVSHPIYGARPSLRGRFHQAGAVISVPLGAQLVAETASTTSPAVTLAYVVTAALMFTTSAAYHRLAQSVIARFWMRRLDHSMIFVHMAGATTPIAVVGIGGWIGRLLLILSWSLAVVGVGLKMTRLTADHDPCPWLFPLLGTLPMLAVPALISDLGLGCGLLLVASGLLYAAGATCFVRKAPNPKPTVFGYHEIWHLFTLLGGACEFLVMLDLLG